MRCNVFHSYNSTRYVTLATDRVSRRLQTLRKGTPDGDRCLSVRLGVIREGRQSRSRHYFISRMTRQKTDTFVSRSLSYVSSRQLVDLYTVSEMFINKKANLYLFSFISFYVILFYPDIFLYICVNIIKKKKTNYSKLINRLKIIDVKRLSCIKA